MDNKKGDKVPCPSFPIHPSNTHLKNSSNLRPRKVEVEHFVLSNISTSGRRRQSGLDAPPLRYYKSNGISPVRPPSSPFSNDSVKVLICKRRTVHFTLQNQTSVNYWNSFDGKIGRAFALFRLVGVVTLITSAH